MSLFLIKKRLNHLHNAPLIDKNGNINVECLTPALIIAGSTDPPNGLGATIKQKTDCNKHTTANTTTDCHQHSQHTQQTSKTNETELKNGELLESKCDDNDQLQLKQDDDYLRGMKRDLYRLERKIVIDATKKRAKLKQEYLTCLGDKQLQNHSKNFVKTCNNNTHVYRTTQLNIDKSGVTCHDRYVLFNILRDLYLESCYVIKNIKNLIRFAAERKQRSVMIYYTGHGQKHTGDWCFHDKSLSLYDILDAIESVLMDIGCKDDSKMIDLIYFYCDCCYSGNWCQYLVKSDACRKWCAKNRVCIVMYAASLPNKDAYDTPDGGQLTQHVFGGKYIKYNACNAGLFCSCNDSDNECKVSYFFNDEIDSLKWDLCNEF